MCLTMYGSIRLVSNMEPDKIFFCPAPMSASPSADNCNQKKYMEMVLQVVGSPPYPVGKVAQRTFQLLKFLMAVFSFSHQFVF